MFKNQLKTTLLLASLSGLLMIGGFYLGGQSGAITAFAISLAINFGSYWFSDKIVLKMYKAQPIDQSTNREIYSMIQEVAQAANLPTPKTYIIPMTSPNAFATGRNPSHAAVALSNGIIELLTPKELKGVIAHEMAHIKNRDTLISTMAATIAGAISYLSQMLYFGTGLFGSRDRNNAASAVGMIGFALLAPIAASMIQLAVSRSREFMADETGARFTRDPLSLANALAKLNAQHAHHPIQAQPKYEATAHLFISNPFRSIGISKLFSTHPPMHERIDRLKNLQF